MNPLDWPGPYFLAFYVPLLVLAFFGSFMWRRALDQPTTPPTPRELELSPEQVAVLDGQKSAVCSTVVELVHQGCLRFEERRLSVAVPLPARASDLKRAVYRAVEAGPIYVETLRTRVKPELERVEDTLRELGFMRSREQHRRYLGLPWLVFLVTVGLGVAKLAVGIERDKPVQVLVCLLMPLVPAWALLLWFNGWLFGLVTPRGHAALEMLKKKHEPLRVSASTEGSARALRPRDLALAVGLFGVWTLPAADFAAAHSYLRAFIPNAYDPSNGSSSDSSSSSSGDSGGGGGGGGCGGCGGGGSSD
ncbi:TIGR04222 domain-containing membrane protein [Archangium sp. Cb G35]|uniref:TIGR04222 domain-containing membrane protein n=1 Tax=Archangium sp. Cb G35 TaxID=1920190 RepID=UPI000935B17C|nr:TIGR04222 domain-containing membrane protein [Archangium sp. Cb G35]